MWLAIARAGAQTAGLPAEGQTCSPPEPFSGFVKQFKEIAEFRRDRIVFPLPVMRQNPDGTSSAITTLVAHETYRDLESFTLMVRADAARLKATEGELCESVTGSGGERTLAQNSCHTDVYANGYEFKRVLGCWKVARVWLGGS